MILYSEQKLGSQSIFIKTILDNENNEINVNLTGKKVAIIGSGPSGLTAAAFLARKGHSVTVFEARENLGGWLSYGIPPHRLPKHAINQDLKYIEERNIFVDIKIIFKAFFVLFGDENAS